MCPIASLFVLQRLKGSMSDDARDFNNIETRAYCFCVRFVYQQSRLTSGYRKVSPYQLLLACKRFIISSSTKKSLGNTDTSNYKLIQWHCFNHRSYVQRAGWDIIMTIENWGYVTWKYRWSSLRNWDIISWRAEKKALLPTSSCWMSRRSSVKWINTRKKDFGLF